jgi:hypothetical protein
MDFFTDPDEISLGRALVLQQLPKKIGGVLQTLSSRREAAWGIYYKEGWDWVKVWYVLGFGFFLPSLLFGILWGILKKVI